MKLKIMYLREGYKNFFLESLKSLKKGPDPELDLDPLVGIRSKVS
jgi:hypothetical protein